jgi:hypothetical protein
MAAGPSDRERRAAGKQKSRAELRGSWWMLNSDSHRHAREVAGRRRTEMDVSFSMTRL